jgi:periplasmic protein TonB
MVPSTHIEVTSEPEAKKTSTVETPVLEPRTAKRLTSHPKRKITQRPEEGSFQSSLIEYNRMASSSRLVDVIFSLAVNLAILSAPILTGLYFTDTINLKQLESTFLVAPPPPPPPPPAPAAVVVKAAAPRRVFESAGKLIAPSVIPQKIALIKEVPLPPSIEGTGGVPGGVPGGVAGGSMGGVIGGVIGGVKTSVPIAPLVVKENKPKAPVRVGGHVKEPKIVHRVEPEYPVLAKQVHLQGIVVLEAVLDEQGNVTEMTVVSGPPLLIQAAINAVRQWKYEPTYLNDQPVPVQLNVTVTFRLNQ